MTSPASVLPRATVVICVYTEKRWDDIVAAVGSVRTQDVRAAEVLVVVDHNPALLERAGRVFGHAKSDGAESDDGALDDGALDDGALDDGALDDGALDDGALDDGALDDGALDDGAGSDGAVRVLANAHRQGLSGARNTAVAAASGDVVVFLDDDAAARPGWLRALLAPYADPDVVAVGGVAYPVFPGARPRLLPTGGTGGGDTGELDWVVGCTYTGQPTERAEVRNLMGCNMSVRREVFARVGGFAEDLGRIGRNPLGCEETELCIRIRQSYRRMGREARIVFEPAAQVDHRVTADRIRWAYLRRRSWSEGLSKAAVARLVGSDDALSTERAYAATVLPGAVARELRAARLASALAIVTALATTGAGYLRGKLPGATSAVRLPAADVAPVSDDASTVAAPTPAANRTGGA